MAAKRKTPKRRHAAAKALGSKLYRQRVVPAVKPNKSRGRKRMAEIYAYEQRCVESELEL